mmetsp:Transcript_77917/g.137383  ORF Transcript_77917/g.137383 Transcript_77917/m.137383 type:complete len:432 (-) Transcript_77917:850-2145(-)
MATLLDPNPDSLLPFKGSLSPRFYEVRQKVQNFVKSEIIPNLEVYEEQKRANGWAEPPILLEWQKKARVAGLWNLFLPEISGLTNLEYAPIAEIHGAFIPAALAMNCLAPDTGNMEVLLKYGNAEQKEQWLSLLLSGAIRSCFAMTEPWVASSDATNICSSIVKDGDSYVVNGHKWYISGAMRPSCKLIVFLGKSNPSAPRHQQHSVVLIPMDSPGVKVVRPMGVFGREGDHAEMTFTNVRVPAANLVLGEGRGFEIAQGRLGPGRIHHCMRTIGVAEAALAAMVYRASTRKAFGSRLVDKDTVLQTIAESRLEIEECRQLCYLAASVMDQKGTKAARNYISMIKVAAPKVALKVIDNAIQIHGAHGVSQDSQLSHMYAELRTLRVADGPDVVHLNTVAKAEVQKLSEIGAMVSGAIPKRNVTTAFPPAKL